MSKRDRIQLKVEEPLLKQQEASNDSQVEHAPPTTSAQGILQMQRTHGNRAVRRMLARVQRSSLMEGGPLNSEVSEEINRKRGTGGSLDSRVQAEMGGQLGRDFSDVSIHTDSRSHELNQQLGAKAFTTGKDIFFSQGSYQPNSSEGKQLLAHELTHVIHQDGSMPSGDLTLGPADDSYEREADQVASTVTSGAGGVQAKFAGNIQRQAPEEEELKLKRDPSLQRAADEDELMQAKRDPDMQRAADEDELMQAMRDPNLQREAEEEELL